MFHSVFDRAPQARDDRRSFSRYIAFAAILLSLDILAACGGHSSLSNTGSSGIGLNISASLPAASVGTNYNAAITVSGGTAPYKFSVASGQLPTGVSLGDKTGNFSGTPSAAGSFNFSVSVSDSKGSYNQKPLQIAVSNSSNPGGSSSGSGGGSNSGGSNGGSGSGAGRGPSFSNVQKAQGWGQFGQGPPSFVDCSPSPCDGISFSMTQGVNSPSMSGSATIFNVGGSTPYSDALWNNHLIGPASSQGTFDGDGSLVPNLHDFTYDVYFYSDNMELSEALEFDINQFFGGMGFIFGHECRLAAGNEWDVWDNKNAHWVSTGVPCHPNNHSWNHLTLKMQRTSDNHLTYQSITLNGDTRTLNWSFEHGSAPNWYGLTVNYQMDGNFKQDSYNTYLDNLTISYQ